MPGQYADWVDVGHAIEHWCSNHAGQSMAKGTKIDDGDIGGFWVQGKNPHRAKLHGEPLQRPLLIMTDVFVSQIPERPYRTVGH